MPGLAGLGGTYRDLVGHTRKCGTWWGILGLAGQIRRIVVNKSVVKPLCDQLLSGDEGEGGDLECRGGQVFGAL